MENYILEGRNLTKYFKASEGIFSGGEKTFAALSNISVGVKRSVALGIVGESGSGKTTLANILSGIIKPEEGEIFYNGNKITIGQKSYISYRKNVQVVFQDPYSSLNPRLKILTSLSDGLKRHFPEIKDVQGRCEEILTRVGLKKEHLFRYPHQFSGGQKQRISIARALILNPEVIVADEPVSSLDVSVQAQILNIFKDLKTKENKTIILISHDLAVVNFLCDEILVIYNGIDLEFGKTEDVIKNPIHPYTKSLIDASMNIFSKGIEREVDSPCPFAKRCPHYEKSPCSKPIEKKYNTNNHFHRCSKF